MDDVKPYFHQYYLLSVIDIEKFLDSDAPNDLKMALVRKLFKRSKKNLKMEETSVETEERPVASKVAPVLPQHVDEAECSISREALVQIIPGSFDGDSMLANELNLKRKQLNSTLRKVRRQEERLAQRRRDIIAMDNEISELMWMIALAKRQKIALDDEALNKRCEMKFLRKEAPECCESEVKKREPLFFKKYNNIKTSAEAKNMMNTVRQRQRALHYLELMVYNKYLELQYNTKSEEVRKRTTLMSRDKSRNFGHLVEGLNLLSNFEVQIQSQRSNSASLSPIFGQPEEFTSEPDDNLIQITTEDLPTTIIQTTGSPIYTTPNGTGGLLFHLATPAGENDQGPIPLLESML